MSNSFLGLPTGQAWPKRSCEKSTVILGLNSSCSLHVFCQGGIFGTPDTPIVFSVYLIIYFVNLKIYLQLVNSIWFDPKYILTKKYVHMSEVNQLTPRALTLNAGHNTYYLYACKSHTNFTMNLQAVCTKLSSQLEKILCYFI